MSKFLSGRVNLKEFSGLSSDRHLYLSLDEAEPNLGFPGEKPLAVSEEYYTLVTIANGTTFDRYWTIAPPTEFTGGISIFDEGILVGTANSATAAGSISTITVEMPIVTISDTPPVSPFNGDLWWNSSIGDLRIWYQDPDSAQWVDANGGSDNQINPWVINPGFTGIHTLGLVGIGKTVGEFYLEVAPVGYSNTSVVINGDSKFNGNAVVGILTTNQNLFIGTTKSLYLGISTFYGGLSPGLSGGIDLYFGPSGIGTPDDRKYRFALQNDRNIVLYDGITAIWNTGTNISDEKLKDNIRSTNINSLTILNNINVVDFEWKHSSDLYDGGLTHTGFIAQNVEDEIPDAVREFSGIKLVDKEEMIPVLWKALQEALYKIDILESRITELEINTKI
jgi:hypothetical protein